MRPLSFVIVALAWCALTAPPAQARQDEPRRIQALFLGDDGHHEPALRAQQILPAFAERGIDIFYTDDVEDLNPATLGRYDVLMVYANYMEMTEDQEQALLGYVAGGGGFVPIHSASGMFRNSEAYIELVGGAFESHGTGIFRAKRVNADHPAIEGVPNFESWDETYVHQKLNPDNVILEQRVEEDHAEPWTWVRTHGDGRVFYTAWGHDHITWSNPGFQQLLERGVRWAAGDWALDVQPAPSPFAYVEAELPSLEYNSTIEHERELRPMQEPLSVEASMARMVVEPSFEVKLFAAEPDIVKPIAMAWDERGRLWIAETVDYPNDLQEGEGQGHDRIKICEDTDGDGRADTFTVFAEGLSIPTSLTFAKGGVVVAQAPDMLFLKDTDGDDRADVREVLFTGWGTFDTHAGPSNLRWGFDNWIWGVLGYAGFEGEVGGEPHKFTMGFYRFRPDGSELEFIRGTNNNTWGLGFSEEGLAFASTANNNPSVYMPIADRYYKAVRGWAPGRLGTIAPDPSVHPITEKTRQGDHKGKYTAGAGHALYTARSFPQDYWNRVAFVGAPTVRLLGKFALEPEGSDFVAHNEWNMLASDDGWTAPVAAEVGPDGALWMIDWYNFVPQHNLGPFSEGWEHGKNNAYLSALRDKERGRIYRIVYKEAEPYEPLRLDSASQDELVQALTHDNLFWRMTAQRLLVERGETDVLPALFELVRDSSVDEVGLNPGAIHALWTMHGLEALLGTDSAAVDVATEALRHPSAGVRRAALEVLPNTAASQDALLEGKLLEDENARVRLDALLALAEMPVSEEAGAAVFAMLQNPENAEDAWIPDAATAAGAQHRAGFLKAAYEEGGDDPSAGFSESVQRAIGIVSYHHVQGQMSGETSEAVPESGRTSAASRKTGKKPGRDGVIAIEAVGNNLEYDTEAIEAKAGSELTIRFINTATSPMMTHNVVVVEKQEDVDAVGRAAITAQENDYIPPTHEDKIIAYTPLAAPGETVEVTFTVPPPGEYPYICTFPGHYVAMQGTLIAVE